MIKCNHLPAEYYEEIKLINCEVYKIFKIDTKSLYPPNIMLVQELIIFIGTYQKKEFVKIIWYIFEDD